MELKFDEDLSIEPKGKKTDEQIYEIGTNYDKEVISEETKQAPGHLQSRMKYFERLQLTEETFKKSGDLIEKDIRNNKGELIGYENKTSLAAMFSNGVYHTQKRRGKKISPDEMKSLAFEYFLKIDSTDQKPNLAGLCANMGISKSTFKNYLKDVSDPEYAETCMVIENTLMSALAEGSHIKDILELKNTHDYKDKSEQVVKVENALDEISDEDLDKQIQRLEKNADGVYE